MSSNYELRVESSELEIFVLESEKSLCLYLSFILKRGKLCEKSKRRTKRILLVQNFFNRELRAARSAKCEVYVCDVRVFEMVKCDL